MITIGSKVVVVDKSYGGITNILAPTRTPQHLVGKMGVVVDEEDGGYNCSNPTGYERSYFTIKTESGEEFDVDSAAVRIVI